MLSAPMRLLHVDTNGSFKLTASFRNNRPPPYAILSHVWAADNQEEVTFEDLTNGMRSSKRGYQKLRFCSEEAKRDGLSYFWVDSCCIDKRSSAEVAEAINSMFRWYQNAAKCYVYLSDVSIPNLHSYAQSSQLPNSLSKAFKKSKWFTRGWTLQELLAPRVVEFFSREGRLIGDKFSLEHLIHDTTKIAVEALRGRLLSQFSISERMSWAVKRETTYEEDQAYCLFGIFDIHLGQIYGEGLTHAFRRFWKELPALGEPYTVQEHLATICIQYLLRNEEFLELCELLAPITIHSAYENAVGNFLNRYPFMEYAIKEWHVHIKATCIPTGIPSPSLANMVDELLSSSEHRNSIMILTYYFKHNKSWWVSVGQTALHIAAYFNFPWLVERYISQGKIPVNAVSLVNDTPLVWASENGNVECVTKLLDAGADPTIPESDGWSALHWAAKKGYRNITILLLERGARRDQQDSRGYTPLDWAREREHWKVAKVLEMWASGEEPENPHHSRQQQGITRVTADTSFVHPRGQFRASHSYRNKGNGVVGIG